MAPSADRTMRTKFLYCGDAKAPTIFLCSFARGLSRDNPGYDIVRGSYRRGNFMRGNLKLAATIALLTASLMANAGAAEPRVPYTPVQYLKNFALSVCLGEGFKSDADVAKEATAAAGGYLELGKFPFEAHEEAAALAKKFLAKEYLSMHGQKLTVMKCIDLFHSKELDRLARKYNRK
jgi:hypothetical protein